MTSAGSFPSYLLAARTASWLDDKQTALGTNEGTWIHPLNVSTVPRNNGIYLLITVAYSLSRVQIFATPWAVACQALLSMGFSQQEYWSGLPCPPSGDLSHPRIKSLILSLLHWEVGSLPLVPTGKSLSLAWWSHNVFKLS